MKWSWLGKHIPMAPHGLDDEQTHSIETAALGAVVGLAIARAWTASSGSLSLNTALALMALGSAIMLLSSVTRTVLRSFTFGETQHA